MIRLLVHLIFACFHITSNNTEEARREAFRAERRRQRHANDDRRRAEFDGLRPRETERERREREDREDHEADRQAELAGSKANSTVLIVVLSIVGAIIATCGGFYAFITWAPHVPSMPSSQKVAVSPNPPEDQPHPPIVVSPEEQPDPPRVIPSEADPAPKKHDPIDYTVVEKISFLVPPPEIGALAVSPDGKVLATATAPGTIHLWNLETGAVNKTLNGGTTLFKTLAFSPDGKLLGGGDTTEALAWNPSDGRIQAKLALTSCPVQMLAFDRKSRLVATACDDNLQVRDLMGKLRGKRMINFQPSGAPERIGMAFSKGGESLAAATRPDLVKIWDAETGWVETIITGHGGAVWSVAYSPDGRLLATAGEDGAVRLWDVTKSYQLVVKWQPYPQQIRCVTFSYDGRFLAVCGDMDNPEIKILNLEEYKECPVITCAAGFGPWLAFLPGGQSIVVQSGSNRVRVLDLSKVIQP